MTTTTTTTNVDPIQRLVRELARLPGVGERSATRLAFFILRHSEDPTVSLARDLAAALTVVDEQVGLCQRCRNFCAGESCSVCNDSRRDAAVVCVVEGVGELRAIEQSGAFRGTYHVLHGALAPLDGIGPDELKLDLLVRRAQTEGWQEVILATNTTVEGDATALYLARLLEPVGVKVSRLASGVPIGGELEYLDKATLGRALAERKEV